MITNPPQRLTVHCKSKDDDIGEHKIRFGENFHFHFKPNVIPSTLFHCRFCWPCDTSVHHFDIYDQTRDVDSCVKHQGGVSLCSWKIWKTGPCRFNGQCQAYTDCYPWSHPPTIATPSIVNASHVSY
ncbi:hypothetical protein K1719_045904 [Acacia pycnantha]|nr:hypothetical protein K1719_045904 [Acacia pycnantha]